MKFIAVMISLLFIYSVWIWWDVRQLKELCSDVPVGMAVSALPALVESHGYKRHWVEFGVHGKTPQDRMMYVPSAATVGEVVCAIHANEGVIVSAVMEDM
jgi:hypothetical protein